MATVLFFTGGYDPEEIIASCFLGVYAALAFLECSIDFCMGCVMFGWAVKFGLLPREVRLNNILFMILFETICGLVLWLPALLPPDPMPVSPSPLLRPCPGVHYWHHHQARCGVHV